MLCSAALTSVGQQLVRARRPARSSIAFCPHHRSQLPSLPDHDPERTHLFPHLPTHRDQTLMHAGHHHPSRCFYRQRGWLKPRVGLLRATHRTPPKRDAKVCLVERSCGPMFFVEKRTDFRFRKADRISGPKYGPILGAEKRTDFGCRKAHRVGPRGARHAPHVGRQGIQTYSAGRKHSVLRGCSSVRTTALKLGPLFGTQNRSVFSAPKSGPYFGPENRSALWHSTRCATRLKRPLEARACGSPRASPTTARHRAFAPSSDRHLKQ